MPAGNHNNRYMWRFLHRLNPFRQFDTANSRHHDIANDHIRINFIQYLLHPFRLLQGDHIKIVREDFPDEPQHFQFIINHQQCRPHLVKFIVRKFQHQLRLYFWNVFRSDSFRRRYAGSHFQRRQWQSKQYPAVRRIFHFQRTIQQFRHIVGNGKSQPITGEVLFILVFKAIQDSITVENILKVFFFNRTSLIGNPENQQVFIVGIHFYFDTFPIRSILEGIGYQIDNNSIQKTFVWVPGNLLGYLAQERDIPGFSHIDKGFCRIFH